MTDSGTHTGAGGSFGEKRGGFGMGRGRRRPRRSEKDARDTWQPVTKLGRLVKEQKIKSLEVRINYFNYNVTYIFYRISIFTRFQLKSTK
jgi:hypothetical protein